MLWNLIFIALLAFFASSHALEATPIIEQPDPSAELQQDEAELRELRKQLGDELRRRKQLEEKLHQLEDETLKLEALLHTQKETQNTAKDGKTQQPSAKRNEREKKERAELPQTPAIQNTQAEKVKTP